MSGEEVPVLIDDRQVREMLRRAPGVIPALINEAAKELQAHLERESAEASTRVSESWKINQAGQFTSTVSSDVFFAGWLARGTRPHGPASAPRMVFSIDGHGVSASFVQGIPADPFEERAIAKAQDRVPTMLEYLVAEAGG